MPSFPIDVPQELIDAVVSEAVRQIRADLADPSGTEWPPWMSVETAARYLDVSPERVRKLQARREIPYHQEAPGCRVLFSRTDLDAWMGQFRHPNRPSHLSWDRR